MSKRKSLSIGEKANIIYRLESGETNGDISKHLKLSPATISTIWRNQVKIKEAFENDCLKSKKLRKSSSKNVEEALLKWFKIQRSSNIPINGPLLLDKATEFAKLLNLSFEPDSSWIQRFRKRHEIVLDQMSAQSPSSSAPLTDKETWLTTVWPKLRESYTDDEIFNADETGLFFKLTPDKTLRFKGERCSGGRLSKERITVMVASNMSGTVKRKLFVIGKSKRPRCFKGVKHLPVDYESNKRALMTSDLFINLLFKWDTQLRVKNKKILLLVDNCPAHPKVKSLKQIKLVFLPANTTSILQPMDQGIIKSLKVKFRKQVVLQMIKNIEIKNESGKIDLLDAINMIARAWDDVSAQTIANCFYHTGFNKLNEGEQSIESTHQATLDEIEADQEWVSNLQLPEHLKIQNFKDYVLIDENLETVPAMTDDEILWSVQDEPGEDESDEEEAPALVTLAEAAKGILDVRSFVTNCLKDVPSEVVDAIRVVEEAIDSVLYFKYSKQST